MGRFTNFLAGPGLYDLPGHHVDAVMINYPQYCSTAGRMQETLRILKQAKPQVVFMDSGGFQKLTAEIKRERSLGDSVPSKDEDLLLNLSPESIVEAAAELRPTAMMALDSPIRKIEDQDEREKEFRRKLDRNVKWAVETSELRLQRCPEVGLFVPVQCYSLRHLEEFINAIKGIHLTGLSLPIRGMSLLEVALFLLRFRQVGIRNVHLLGVSAFFPMALGAYFARQFFESMSLDAKTWKERAIHNEYTSSHDLTRVKISGGVVIPEGTVLDCTCSVCLRRSFSYFKHLPYAERAILLRSHNWWVTERAARDLFNHASSISSLRKHLLKRTLRWGEVEDLCVVLDLVETFKGHDLRYLEGMQINNKKIRSPTGNISYGHPIHENDQNKMTHMTF
jgi:tRNA-guanine family transglycosylase